MTGVLHPRRRQASPPAVATAGEPAVPATAPDPPRSGRGGPVGRRPIWMTTPALILLLVVVGLPVALDFYISFFKVNISTLAHWFSAPAAGIGNYITSVTGSTTVAASAIQALGVSVGFSVLTTVLIAPIGVLVALALNHQSRGRSAFRSIFLIPYVIPTFVTAVVARMMFMNKTGLVDKVLSALHLAGVNTYWLLGPNTFWSMVLTDVWASWPFVYIMVLAGLSSIPVELYEAAELDGAGYLDRIRYVVLPQLKPLLMLALLLSTIYHFGNFTLPFIMFGDPPPVWADGLPLDIYYRAFTSFQYGIAAATAVLTLVVMAVPGYIYLRMTRLGAADAV